MKTLQVRVKDKHAALLRQMAREAKRGEESLHLGPLNPDWVEWLMGWPIGWTDLKPLGTGRFQEWQQQHSPS